jgi:hypothetical protein
MPNIQTLNLLVDENEVVVNAPTAIDLNCTLSGEEKAKSISAVYLKITGANVSESLQALPGFTLVTKIINFCNGKISYVSNPYDEVAALVVNPCPICATKPLGSDCSNPMKVQICGGGGGGTAAPQIDKEVNYVENLTTGFLDKVINTWVDGVLQPEVVVATTLKVQPLQHDFEYVCDTVTGFLQQIEKITNADGTVTTNITATTIGCSGADTFAKIQVQKYDCAGNPVGSLKEAYSVNIENTADVKECNSAAILAALNDIKTNTALSNANEALINTALNNILNEVINVAANTDTIETKLQTLIDDQLAGNTTLTNIKTVLDNAFIELQNIAANTDTVEALITATNTKLDSLISLESQELVELQNVNTFLNTQKTLSKVVKTVSNDVTGIDPAVVPSPFNIQGFTSQPLRSVTFTLWGVDAANTVLIDFAGNQKLYNKTRYDGYSFTFNIDKLIDFSLEAGKDIVVVGNAEVDVIFTYEN